MKLTKEQAEALLWEEYEDDFGIEHQSEWEHSHKYQHKEVVFTYEGKSYMLQVSRSGSDFSEWYYDFTLNCPEVEKKEVITYVWEPVS